ncbi:MAG TPA: hypothetical protein DCF63_20405 [Planctomycetaceae bacterium]|nr:hypothetical protein [Planctomycetaceae bacterium]
MTKYFVLSIQCIAVLVMLAGISSRSAANDDDSRHFNVEIELYSYVPEQGISSYRWYGKGSGSGNHTAGFFANDERQFSVVFECLLRSGKYVANVRVEPKDSDLVTVAMNREFILSNLELQTLEIVRNDDGRVYRLQIIPDIVEPQKPTRVSIAALKLDQWSFPDSVVILNDQDYVGRLSGSGGPLASMDIAGVANVEFAPVPFRGATPDGVLKDGVVTLRRSDGTTLQIANVAIGVQGNLLSNGPYKVFVRWSEPKMTLDRYREELPKWISQLRERIASGEAPGGSKHLERLERSLQSDRVMVFESGLGSIPRQDRIPIAVP